jgi:methyltransferase (TIGR00027 family)
MQHGEASKTAEFNAVFRAIESYRRPRRKRLFADMLAPCFFGARARKFFRFSRVPLLGHLVTWYIDKKWPGVRPSSLGRTCWIDDQLRDAMQDGADQIVILGAGYDCRAYRLPGIESRRVFELDQQSMIAVKKKCLASKLGALPGHVTYVEVDFDRQDLADVLPAAGFDRTRRTFFIWEGVMHYLTAEAVDKTLRTISSMAPPGSRLVFTYVHRGLLDGTVQFGRLGEIPATLQESGETWKFGLYPEELPGYLAERGLTIVVDASSMEYRARYMGPSGRHMRGFEFYHAAMAKVSGTGKDER